MDTTTILIASLFFILGLISGGAAIWFIRQKAVANELQKAADSQEQLTTTFEMLSKKALTDNLQTFLALADNKFKGLLNSSNEQLEQKKDSINETLKGVKGDLDKLAANTVALKAQMEESGQRVGELQATTTQLRQILSSSQARGQWGERMVEDILNFIGLRPGINYAKQTQVGTGRPDFTFYLPDKKSINMDVKFPLAHYEEYVAADREDKDKKESEKKAFLKDVRGHIQTVAKREYIDPQSGTVDYVLLFIPNESIYAFINEADHELIDFSLKRKVMLCSPITLYAILSLVRQAVSNFAMEMKAGEMQKQVGLFSKQWSEFVDKLERMGGSLQALSNHYDDLSGTRRRALEKPMNEINELELGDNSG